MKHATLGKPNHAGQNDQTFSYCVDRYITFGNARIISGWLYNCDLVIDQDPSTDASTDYKYFSRDDVATGFGYPSELVRGFLIASTASSSDLAELCFETLDDTSSFDLEGAQPSELTAPAARDLLRDHHQFSGMLHRFLLDSPDWLLALGQTAVALSGSSYANGNLELARGIEGIGGIVVGWAVPTYGGNFYLLSESGTLCSLEGASRWNRPDIIEALSPLYGNATQIAGFLSSQPTLRYGEKLYLLFAEGDKLCRLSETEWKPAPKDPLSFARWSFEYPTPSSRFFERLDRHDGPILSKLLNRSKRGATKRHYERQTYGKVPTSPKCAIVVPLYKRYDFMRNQLLELSTDRFIRENCHLVYVLD